MPRPKKDVNSILELELRITPPAQLPITDWKATDEFDELVMFEEGSANGTPKLHYHGYVKTKRSKSWIRNWIYDITNAKQYNADGNSVYFSKQPHEHTFGYIAKSGVCSIRYNVSQTTIDEWLYKSDEYRKQKESQRKRQSRTREDELNTVIKEVEKDLKEHRCNRSVSDVVHHILALCYHQQIRFPMRTQMDSYVLKLLYPYDEYLVRSFYTKSFENIRT